MHGYGACGRSEHKDRDKEVNRSRETGSLRRRNEYGRLRPRHKYVNKEVILPFLLSELVHIWQVKLQNKIMRESIPISECIKYYKFRTRIRLATGGVSLRGDGH